MHGLIVSLQVACMESVYTYKTWPRCISTWVCKQMSRNVLKSTIAWFCMLGGVFFTHSFFNDLNKKQYWYTNLSMQCLPFCMHALVFISADLYLYFMLWFYFNACHHFINSLNCVLVISNWISTILFSSDYMAMADKVWPFFSLSLF